MIEFKELQSKILSYFEEVGYSESGRRKYQRTWNQLESYMIHKNIDDYNQTVGNDFLKERHGCDLSYSKLTRYQKQCIRHITALSDIVKYGQVRSRVNGEGTCIFEGELGLPFAQFISESKAIRSASTIHNYGMLLSNLYIFLRDRGRTLQSFDIPLAIQYLKTLEDEKSDYGRDITIKTIRVFFRYMCKNEYLSDNDYEMWKGVFKLKNTHVRKIPSVYTLEEVNKILSSVDRSQPKGRRDYAMILLAARYGLRASDITGLRFQNLLWDKNLISLIQQKTGKKVSLPLSEEVGKAIISYLKNGRPQINSPYIFITAGAPYKRMTPDALSHNVGYWIRIAGISTKGRLKGAHSLRHSCATNLLTLNSPMPVISEILGHSSSQTTNTYTRVSIDMLRQCALEVPLVPQTFYENLYG